MPFLIEATVSCLFQFSTNSESSALSFPVLNPKHIMTWLRLPMAAQAKEQGCFKQS